MITFETDTEPSIEELSNNLNEDFYSRNFSVKEISESNDYGIMLFKPDAVEKDLVEYLVNHILTTSPLAGKVEVASLAILKPITDPADIKTIYPEQKSETLEANKKLFNSGNSVAVLFKGKGLNMPAELEKLKGKIKTNPYEQGLDYGIRGLIPTIGEEEQFHNIKRKKENGDTLSGEDYAFLARNLAHTPDSNESKKTLLKLIPKYASKF